MAIALWALVGLVGIPCIITGSYMGATWDDEKRSLPLSAAVVQLDAREMRLKDLRRVLHGFHVNVTDMPEGKAMFSSLGGPEQAGLEPVEGMISGFGAKPHHGLHTGNLAFTVPGLDGTEATDVRGNWLMVSRSEQEADAEVTRKFGELYGKLQEGEGHAKEAADMVKAVMQAS